MPEEHGAAGPRVRWGLVIHGGVGVLPRVELTPELEADYLRTLEESLAAGYTAMKGAGTAVDGVVEAIAVMEDSVLFNAGRGSNFTSEGVVSMDASIMVGDDLEAGAVAGVRSVRNPIRLARRVMEDCPHVMLAGAGADEFAREKGLQVEGPEYFFTQRRWDELQAAKAREAQGAARPNTVDMEEALAIAAGAEPPSEEELRHRSGTVGAVALDEGGRLVAGTSTGGSANKKWGRIGDSPVISAGTYAGSHCGVSCTGWGEYFIRNAVAHDIQARMAYLGLSLSEASRQVIMERLQAQRKGLGGIVAMDRDGHVEMCFNTRGMYRGWVDQDGKIQVAIF
jgi:beta-aspartyl-peptidase (threonine type)